MSIPPSIESLEYVERLSVIADRCGMTLQEVDEFVSDIAEDSRNRIDPPIAGKTEELTALKTDWLNELKIPRVADGHVSFRCLNDRQRSPEKQTRDLENRFFDMGPEVMRCAIEKTGGSFEPKAITLFSISLKRSTGVPLFDGATLSRIGSASGCHFEIPEGYFRPNGLTLTGVNISPKSLIWPETMILLTSFNLVGEEDESFWAFLISRIGDGKYEVDRMTELKPNLPNTDDDVVFTGRLTYARQAEAAQIARGLDRSLQAIHALTAMCRQWLSRPDAPHLLDHSFISACEFAIDVLMDLGICAEGDKGFYLVDPPPTDQEIIDRLTAP